MQSRASLCELLAVKLISRFASNYMQLVAVLTTSWCPLAGASSATVEEVKYAISGHDLETSHTALEVGTTPGPYYRTQWPHRWQYVQAQKPSLPLQ